MIWATAPSRQASKLEGILDRRLIQWYPIVYRLLCLGRGDGGLGVEGKCRFPARALLGGGWLEGPTLGCILRGAGSFTTVVGGRVRQSVVLTCSLARVPRGGRPLPALSPHATAHSGSPRLRFRGFCAPEPGSGLSRSACGRIPNPPFGRARKLSAARLPPPPPPPHSRQGGLASL